MKPTSAHHQPQPAQPQRATQAGFTLIELLAVTSIMIILLLTASALFLTFMINGAKVNIQDKIKAEGSRALHQMEFVLRNSHGIIPTTVCASGEEQESIHIQGLDNQTTTLGIFLDTDNKLKLASSSAATTPATNYFLTSDYPSETEVFFYCYNIPQKNSQYVTIRLVLTKGNNSTDNIGLAKSGVTNTFIGGVTIRN